MTEQRPFTADEWEAYNQGYARAQRDLDPVQKALDHSPLDLRKAAADLLRSTSDMCDASGPDAAEDWLLNELRRLTAAARAPAFEAGLKLGLQSADMAYRLGYKHGLEGKPHD